MAEGLEGDLVDVDFAGADEGDLFRFDFAEVDEEHWETHMNNNGVVQRTNLTGQDQLRKKGVVLCGKLAEEVHGQLKAGGDPCTLLVLEWYVVTRKRGVRIESARIDVTFHSARRNARYESERTLETTKGWRPTLKLGKDGVAAFELPFVYELKETGGREKV
jgi:hypothetical protein